VLLRTIAIGALAFALGVPLADAAPRPQRERHARRAQPAMPAPPPEAARLAALKGVWMFDGTVSMNGRKPRKARWRINCKEAAGGWSVACDETIHLPRMGNMRGHTLFGYDSATGRLHIYTVNNMGEVRDLPGKWADDRTITYRYEGTQGGKPLVQEARIALTDAGTIDVDLKVTVGGQPMVAFDGAFHKKPPKPRRARVPRGDAAAPAEPAPAPAE
jgi:hypothetical protein